MEEVSLPLFSCRCFGYEVPVQAEDQRVWDLSCLNVQGIFSVDLKKFLDFFKLHTLFFFFFPLLVSMCTRTEKLCLSQKNNGSFLQKKKKALKSDFQLSVTWLGQLLPANSN